MIYKVNDTEEVWKSIKGFEGLYEVSNLGRVKSLPRVIHRKSSMRSGFILNGSALYIKGKIIKPLLQNNGYYSVSLYDHSHKNKLSSIHRLVAEAFIPNPLNLPQVNHKDENKANNRADNLEWCTARYNRLYSSERIMASIRRKSCKKVVQLSLNDEEIATYDSLTEASIATNIDIRYISKVAKGQRNKTHGYKFKFL